MTALVALGFGLALLGMAGLVRCILVARRLRAAPEAEARTRLRGLVLLNTVSLGTGFLGAALALVGFVLRD